MSQTVLDSWFLRQDIIDQLIGQEEDVVEAERFADRIMTIAQEDGAEHQVLIDPFDRSVALVLSLVQEEGMDPWNIDLSAFLKLFTQRVRKEANSLDLPACGRLIRLSWEVLNHQASTLFERVIALDLDDEEEFGDFGWESEYDDEEFMFTASILEGNADAMLPDFFGESIRRDEGRPSTLGELLSALKDACDEAEILKVKEENRRLHAEELENLMQNVGARMHVENLEEDLEMCWKAMRTVISSSTESKIPIDLVTEIVRDKLVEQHGFVPDRYELESKITSFVAGLFLTHRGLAMVSQEGAEDQIMIEDKWPKSTSYAEATSMSEKLAQKDSNDSQSDDTGSVRHALNLLQRAKEAEEKAAAILEEKAAAALAEETIVIEDWLVE
ncbi:MAG: hypothetical protein CXT71_02150 [Methanobacteriota archaeon]|nr:MAG: hypothetical protein CXT71_02150 [Euryarchaeota archaeon]